jgi:hypothetical protein
MAAFKAAANAQGCCQVCGGPADVAHHVTTAQEVRRAGGDLWSPANSIALCEVCHIAHHNRTRPIPLSAVPEAAVEFADELLGQPAADVYFTRYYGPSPLGKTPLGRWMNY